jgi:FMN phosphatase YigB (HAD superfamily)
MRDRDRLSAVWPWLVSSDVGTQTSNAAMFEVLRRESSIAHGHCLYVDTDVIALDRARELGMRTALFDTGSLELPAVIGHPVVHDFRALFAGR